MSLSRLSQTIQGAVTQGICETPLTIQLITISVSRIAFDMEEKAMEKIKRIDDAKITDVRIVVDDQPLRDHPPN